ncbi:GTP-binding protein rhb1 [Mycena kentingensis (nom. inval.)]|nr:GTP-binding protein rhb1 [Mycena kentingensis (nom. inval.)]
MAAARVPDRMKARKIVVLGARSVGKSSLIRQFVDNSFDGVYHPTLAETSYCDVPFGGEVLECQIIDTAGHDEYTLLSNDLVVGIHGYVLVYSITSRMSLEVLEVIYDKILDFAGEKMPAVVVGSKSDLVQDHQVTPAEGQSLARKIGAPWIATSSATNQNIAQVFDLCLQEIQRDRESKLRVMRPAEEARPAGRNCVLM